MSVLLKLTLPDEPGFYSDLVAHPRVLRVVALSGGYARLHACDLLALNPGVVASFSRALTEGLSADQADEEFTSTLNASIQLIYEASMA
jgi:fructose-bisphosphate aldolase class I